MLKDHLDTKRVEITQHARERMDQRHVPEAVLYAILRSGNPTEMFNTKEYPYGEHPYQNRDPVFTFVGMHHNDPIAVGLALRLQKDSHGIAAEFKVLTVINSIEHSRHSKK